jgi:hypothetical protein
MAPLVIKAKELYSRIERVKIGKREIGKIQPDGSLTKRESGGIIGFVFGGLKGFATQVVSLVFAGLGFSWTNLWGAFVGSVNFLWNFNWNISDAEIDNQVKSLWLSYASQLGGLVGNSLGYFTCGIIPAASLFAFNPAMAAYVINYSKEDIIDELASNMAQAIRATATSLAQSGFYIAYKNIRKVLRNPGSPLRGLIPGIDKWGKSGGPVVSLAKGYETQLEKIKNPFAKNFTEALLEEWWEGCVEAGFIIAGAMDSFIYQQKALNKQQETDVIEVIPNREAPDEAILLSGSKNELKTAITSTLAVHQLIQNRDIATFVGEPAQIDLKARPSEIIIHIHYSSNKKPPFRTKDAVRVQVQIANAKRSKLSWLDIKNAADPNGYLWGNFEGKGKTDSGRQITVYGATSAIAQDRVQKLAVLTTDEINVINVTEVTGKGGKFVNPQLRKKPTMVFPVKCVIGVQKISKFNDGKVANDGKNRLQEFYDFPLWTDEAPSDFNKQIARLFTTGDEKNG